MDTRTQVPDGCGSDFKKGKDGIGSSGGGQFENVRRGGEVGKIRIECPVWVSLYADRIGAGRWRIIGRSGEVPGLIGACRGKDGGEDRQILGRIGRGVDGL